MERILKKTYDPRYQAMLEIGKLRDPQIKAACIERGFEANKLAIASLAEVTTWLIEHYHDVPVEERMKALGNHYPEVSKAGGVKLKSLNIPDREDAKKIITPKRVAGQRKEKDTELGIFKGTKKEYTYTLSRDLYNKFSKKYTKKELVSKFSGQLFTKILAKFGEASEKSVKIWMKRYLDIQKG